MDLNTLVAQHPMLVRVAVLTVMFAFGAVETWFACRASACVTWFTFLFALTITIALVGTMSAIVVAIGVFSAGLMMLIGYAQLAMERGKYDL